MKSPITIIQYFTAPMNPRPVTSTPHLKCDTIINNSKPAMDTARDEIEGTTIDSNDLTETPIPCKAGRIIDNNHQSMS